MSQTTHRVVYDLSWLHNDMPQNVHSTAMLCCTSSNSIPEFELSRLYTAMSQIVHRITEMLKCFNAKSITDFALGVPYTA